MGDNGIKDVLNNQPLQKPEAQDASNKLRADAGTTNDMSLGTKALRVGQVTLEGSLQAIPGAFNAIKHDLDPANWQETGTKVLTAGALGVALRVALPESGALKVIAGTAMGIYFAKDAAIPVFEAWKNVATKSGDDIMHSSAQSMGNGLGQFAVDGYLTGKIAGYTGRMTPVMGEKFAPTQWKALEGWKTEHLGTSSTIGVGLNTFIGKVDGTMRSFGDKLNPPKPTVAAMTPEAVMETLVKSEQAHGRHDYSEKMYSQGVIGSDGHAHGLDGTVETLLSGVRPKDIPAAKPTVGDSSTTGPMDQVAGWKQNSRGIFLPENLTEAAGDKGTTGAKPEIIVPGSDAAAVKAGTDSAGNGGNKVFTTAEAMTAENMTKLAGVIKTQIASVSDTASAVRDAVGRPTSVVHAATEQNFKPLDPGYLLARNAMMELANQVGDNPRNWMQVEGLFKRLSDATSQAHNYNNGMDGQHIGRMNVYAAENQTTYVRNMIQAGIDPHKAMAQKPLPALVELSDDQMVVGRDPKTGKVVTSHQGPHTVRAIYGPNGEPVWPIDLVKYPVRDLGTRGHLTSGIYGHEFGHDQFGQLGKLDPQVRDAKLTQAAEKAFGAKADEMINIPKAKPGEVGPDGKPAEPVETDMPPLPDQMPMKDIVVNLAKAWADETVADWLAAAETGQSAAPYFQALRKGGQLYNGTVMSEGMRSPENPMGIEAHPVDKVRPLIQAALIRKMAINPDGTSDPALLKHAAALEKYSTDAGKAGDIVIASEDVPGQQITIPLESFKKFLPELVNLQVDTPLPRLQGHTLFEILPDLRKNYARIENVSDTWTDAINNGKAPDTVPFDINTTKMTHVYGAGQPTMLKLIAGGMDPMTAQTKVNEFSDFFGNKFLAGDPHVDPINTPVLKQLQLAPAATIARFPEMASHGIGKVISNQYQVRDWLGRNSLPVTAAGGSLAIQDLMGLQKKKEEILNPGH
ncbi:MAG: hypothetical protein HYX67_12910 [Candidatus Melainabacteria bacterium]|nr:hypothetical protein [Candidatus Melainabacteria bacterium]